MIRLFTGLSLPDDLRERLSAMQAGIPTARWVPPENLHITLRFIGEVDEPMAQAIHESLGEIHDPAFAITIQGIGLFDSGHRAHTLWAGVEKTPPLLHLRDKIESALVRLGLDPEGRKYSPHVTLAKLKGAPASKIQDFLHQYSLFQAGPIEVGRFVLFSSQLGRGHPIYTAEADYPLG